MYTHNLDPILFDFGFMAIRWYSLAYIFGVLLGVLSIQTSTYLNAQLNTLKIYFK